MAHIVCLTSGLTGILYASFELVSRLEAAGHRVTYGTPVAVEEKVRAQGIVYVQLPVILPSPEPKLPAFNGPFAKGKRWWYKLRHIKSRKREALKSLGADAIDALHGQLKPDLLIIDVELHEYILTAYSKNIPLVILSQWFSLWKRPGLAPLLHDTIPGQGLKGHPLAIELSWWRIKAERYWMFAKKKWMSGGTDRRSTLLALARQLQFPLSFIRENYWPGPFTYQKLPVISMTAWEIEFPHQKRDNLYYVGPMVYTQRTDIQNSGAQQKKLAAIFERKRTTGSALICCTVSSLKKGDQFFLKRVIEAVRDQPNWLLILGMGGLLDPDFLGAVPSNVFPFSWLPQLQVLAQADCSINHGGIHTINECIHFQVPMLVYSGKRSDQNGCAARVAYHQLGIVGDKDVDQAVDIRRKIHTLLTDQTYQNHLQQLQQQYLCYKTEYCLENLVNDFLKERKC